MNEDTWGMKWSLIEYAMILLALAILLLWEALTSFPSGYGTSSLIYWSRSFSSRMREIFYFHAQKLSTPRRFYSSWVWWVIFKLEPQMEIAKIYILLIWGVRPGSGACWPRVCQRNPNFPSLEFWNSIWIKRFNSLRWVSQ